jgi:SAM-dependent methyltransferase
MRDDYNEYVGAETREPKITRQDYLTLSRLSKLLRKSVEKYVQEQDVVLDLGCGEKPYQPLFLGKNVIYIGVDAKRNEFVDILCVGAKLPFKDDVFSICIHTQVLEHVDEPKIVVDEIFRVLKPDGLLFLSAPGVWPIHGAPHDYWRWTEYGLRKMLTNFHIHEIHNCGGSAVSIIQLLELYITRRSLGIMAIVFLNKLGDLLDNITWLDAKLPKLTTNYFVIARKLVGKK